MASVTLERATRFTWNSRITKRDYDISLARPVPLLATGKVPSGCPIVILLDSSGTFGTALERLSMYAPTGALQSAVLVGVGYAGDYSAIMKARTRDFTPPTPAGVHPELASLMGTEFGGAEAFLAGLLDELIPEILTRAPEAAAGRVILHGFSLGGLFAAYALLSRPEAFEVVSLASPSLWWNDFAVLDMLPEFKRRLALAKSVPRVVVGAGALEQDEPRQAPDGVDLTSFREAVRRARSIDAAREFAETLADAGFPEVQFVLFAAEDHAGALTAGTGRAIGFALRVEPEVADGSRH
ncbi:MAG TPA: alpha/beta hydrolase-fold protein [Sphingobium sp.]